MVIIISHVLLLLSLRIDGIGSDRIGSDRIGSDRIGYKNFSEDGFLRLDFVKNSKAIDNFFGNHT